MTDEASLLTKTQRKRIRNEFAALDGSKKRRDQQRIRARIAAGVDDFQLLVEYPDEQLRMAFEEHDDDQLTASLADSQLVVERIREIRDIERAAIVARASERATSANEDGTAEPSLKRLTDRPLACGSADASRDGGRSLWSRRADRLFKLSACAVLPVAAIWLIDLWFDTPLLAETAPWWVAFAGVAVPANGVGLAIKLAQFVKFDAIPGLTTFIEDPTGITRSYLVRCLTAPKRVLERSWEKL